MSLNLHQRVKFQVQNFQKTGRNFLQNCQNHSKTIIFGHDLPDGNACRWEGLDDMTKFDLLDLRGHYFTSISTQESGTDCHTIGIALLVHPFKQVKVFQLF